MENGSLTDGPKHRYMAIDGIARLNNHARKIIVLTLVALFLFSG